MRPFCFVGWVPNKGTSVLMEEFAGLVLGHIKLAAKGLSLTVRDIFIPFCMCEKGKAKITWNEEANGIGSSESRDDF